MSVMGVTYMTGVTLAKRSQQPQERDNVVALDSIQAR